ncbi:MFS transporter [archaeon]|nr:MAG: MFS transporter [archaeon]
MTMETNFMRFKLLYFVLFSGLGILMPYIPVFFELLSLSKSRIGILSMLPNLCSFLLAPIFAMLADKFDANCEVIIFGLVTSVASTVTIYFTRSFFALFWVVFAASAFRAPVTPQVDALVIAALPDKTKYGDMRLWGAISFGIFSFLGGSLFDPNAGTDSFKYIFFLHALTFLLAGYIVLSITYDLIRQTNIPHHHEHRHDKTAHRPLLRALADVFIQHPSVFVFSFIVFLSGFGSGVIDAFLFLRLKQLGGSGLVMGLSRFITCAAEVPMFQIAGPLHKRYGTWIILAVTQLAFVLRFTYYAFLTNPWAVLPCEVLHGLTFATMWSVACTYANLISPPECHSTMQALLEGLHWGFGSGMGALVGGFVYDNWGAVWLFEASAVLSVFSLALSIVAYFFAAPDSELQGGYSSVEISEGQEGTVTTTQDDEEEGGVLQVIELGSNSDVAEKVVELTTQKPKASNEQK